MNVYFIQAEIRLHTGRKVIRTSHIPSVIVESGKRRVSEAQDGTSISEDAALNARGRDERVRVRRGREGSGRRCVAPITEVIAVRYGVTSVGVVQGLVNAGEDVVLDEELGTYVRPMRSVPWSLYMRERMDS